MGDITIKEILIGVVVIWFQISLASINTRLTGIETNISNQRVDTAKLQSTVEGHENQTIFLRTKLNEVDTKLSKHIEESPKIKN